MRVTRLKTMLASRLVAMVVLRPPFRSDDLPGVISCDALVSRMWYSSLSIVSFSYFLSLFLATLS